ncbi:MAG: bacillithiol biosynthesis deacetylase BshB1 [Planctomycetaceae bacterium]
MHAPQQPLDLLVIAPHPDDAEISVGGTILKCRSLGQSVGVLELTNGEPTPTGSVARRAAETAAATARLGLSWRANLGLPNRSLVADLAARRKLAEVFRLTRPAVILAPYWEDAHPDHVAASQLCDAARFWAKLSRSDLAGAPFHPPRIYYYWSIHLRIQPPPSFVVDISGHLEGKLEAVRCYESQLEHRSPEFPTLLDDIETRARYWGWAIHRPHGEPFASRESIGIDSFRSLR